MSVISEVDDFARLQARRLIVLNQAYDPDFCPSIGVLKACYSFTHLTIRVEGKSVEALMNNGDGMHNFQFVLAEPGVTPWNRIFKAVLSQVIMRLILLATNEKAFLKSTGEYVEH